MEWPDKFLKIEPHDKSMEIKLIGLLINVKRTDEVITNWWPNTGKMSDFDKGEVSKRLCNIKCDQTIIRIKIYNI